MTSFFQATGSPRAPAHAARQLPDVLACAAGPRIATPQAWHAQRTAVLQGLLDHIFGPMPLNPESAGWELLHSARVKSDDPRLAHATLVSGRVVPAGAPPFAVQLWLPQGGGPHPAIVSGDACWHYATDEVKARVLAAGFALALFNRCEIAPDPSPEPDVSSGWSRPASGFGCHGAIAAWAWGYHRVVDALETLYTLRPDQIVVVGHSRGGKAALLAGATDERIAVTSANNSGAGGAGSFHVLGPGAETLEDIVQAFPHWWGTRLASYAGNVASLPLDTHFLKALVAPRWLLTTEATGDAWANPEGTLATHEAAREVFALLGSADRIGIDWREGGHSHTPEDWSALLAFAGAVFRSDGAAEEA